MISISYLLQFLMLLIISPATWAAIIISKRFTLSFLKICGIAIAFFALLVLFFFIKKNFRISIVPFMWCAFVSLMSIWVMLAFQKYEAWVKLKHLAICSFFVGFFFYTNYNMPFFQQVFSHYFYASTDAKAIKGSTGLSCVTVNVVRGSSIFDQNQYVLLGGYLARVEYEYEVKNKKYTSATKSYSKSNFYCEEPVTTAYFLPLFPSWSIANNDLPEEVYWGNFYKSNLHLLALWTFAVLLGALATKKKKSIAECCLRCANLLPEMKSYGGLEIFLFSPKNRGGPLVASVIFTSITLAAVLMVFSSRSMISVDSLFTIFIMAPFYSLMFALPGLALAYVLLSGRQNKPGFLQCILCSTLIGGLIAAFWAVVWSELGKNVMFCFIAAGPLAGLFYYLIVKPIQVNESADANKK